MNHLRPVFLRLLPPAGIVIYTNHVTQNQLSHCDTEKNENLFFNRFKTQKGPQNGRRVIGLGAAGVDYIVSYINNRL